jgi:hypothetical protein
MKRALLIMIIAGLIVSVNNLFAFELWSGLDTNMTKDQLVAKAKDVFKVSRPVSESITDSFELFAFDKKSLNNQFPKNLIKIDLVSTLPGYSRHYFKSNPLPNICLYLSTNKLFMIATYWDWEMNPEQLLEMLVSQNGNPTGMITANNGYGDKHIYYVWETAEKIMYCIGRGMFVINKQLLIK